MSSTSSANASTSTSDTSSRTQDSLHGPGEEQSFMFGDLDDFLFPAQATPLFVCNITALIDPADSHKPVFTKEMAQCATAAGTVAGVQQALSQALKSGLWKGRKSGYVVGRTAAHKALGAEMPKDVVRATEKRLTLLYSGPGNGRFATSYLEQEQRRGRTILAELEQRAGAPSRYIKEKVRHQSAACLNFGSQADQLVNLATIILSFHLNRNHTVLADSIVDDFESLESGGKLNLADEATKAIILTSFMDPHPSPGFDGDAATGLSLEDATVYLETGGEEHSFARWMAAYWRLRDEGIYKARATSFRVQLNAEFDELARSVGEAKKTIRWTLAEETKVIEEAGKHHQNFPLVTRAVPVRSLAKALNDDRNESDAQRFMVAIYWYIRQNKFRFILPLLKRKIPFAALFPAASLARVLEDGYSDNMTVEEATSKLNMSVQPEKDTLSRQGHQATEKKRQREKEPEKEKKPKAKKPKKAKAGGSATASRSAGRVKAKKAV